MVTEIAVLYVVKDQSAAFEGAFRQAEEIIQSMKGYIVHELLKCMEAADKYLLVVRWQTLEDHTEGFRKHERYADWKKILHGFYDPFPAVEHYKSF